MNLFKKHAFVVSTVLFALTFTGCDMYSYVTPVSQARYENPQWAPPYYQGVRYYYLPDIEAYYDLSVGQFVYLSNGRWYDSPQCPSIYDGFDLNNCFAVALDINIYQPWMHHQYYVSHYPRYYYRDYYDHSNIPYVRGFNENSKSAIYWSKNERRRARSWDSEGLKTNRQFKYTKEDRKQQYNWNNSGTPNRSSNKENVYQQQNNKNNNGTSKRTSGNDKGKNQPQNSGNNNVTPTRSSGADTNRQQPGPTSESTGPTRNTNYYGRTIGQPVKVEKQMRQQPRTPTSGIQDNRRSGNRNEQNNQERK
jgi:hypothetical protein